MENVITFSLEANNVSTQTFHNFETLARACHTHLISLAAVAGMPKKLDVILAENFDKVVADKQQNSSISQHPFSSTRPKSCVAGKNLAQDEAWDHVIIVFNATFWDNEVKHDDVLTVFLQLGLIAHELAHPYIGRMRYKSAPAVAAISDPVRRNARNLARLMIDEYFADLISDIIVENASKNTISGGKTSLHLWDIMGGNHFTTLKAYLSEDWAEIPNYVTDYKANKISHAAMWENVISATAHLFTLYIHARAFADCTCTEIPLFDSPEIKTLPFVQKHIPKSSVHFINQLRNYRPLMSLSEWLAMDTALIPVGEASFIEMWGLLGAKKEPDEYPLFSIILSQLLGFPKSVK